MRYARHRRPRVNSFTRHLHKNSELGLARACCGRQIKPATSQLKPQLISDRAVPTTQLHRRIKRPGLDLGLRTSQEIKLVLNPSLSPGCGMERNRTASHEGQNKSNCLRVEVVLTPTRRQFDSAPLHNPGWPCLSSNGYHPAWQKPLFSWLQLYF